MCSRLVIRATFTLLLCPCFVICYNYDLVFDNEDIIVPCMDDPDNFLNKLFDLGNMHFTYISDDEIKIDGRVTVVGDVDSTDKVWFEADPLKMERGQWKQTVFSVKRADLCSTVFSPTEVWSQVANKIPETERICPPIKGQIYNLNDIIMSMKFMNWPDPYLSGDYKVVIKTKIISKEGTVRASYCAEIPYRMHRM